MDNNQYRKTTLGIFKNIALLAKVYIILGLIQFILLLGFLCYQ